MLVAFVLMRESVFNAGKGPLVRQVTTFTVVNLVAMLQTLLITLYLARILFPSLGIGAYAEVFGHLVGVLLPIITSYFGHKLLTFRL